MEATTDQIDALIGKRSRMEEQTRAAELVAHHRQLAESLMKEVEA